MRGFIICVLCIPFIWFSSNRIIKAINFDINCIGHIKRAADANTVELAKQELDIVLKYLENHNLTSGIVSIFLKQPKNDVGFWYTNLKSSREELDKVDAKTSQLEKTNILMKLRETLLDSGSEGGTVVTCPEGITIYPNNVLYLVWCLFGLFCLLINIVILVLWFNE